MAKSTNLNNIVRKFTPKESFNILKDLIVNKKATNDTYTLILLWLTGVFNKRNHAHLRSLAGGNIIAKDINSNTDGIVELVHEIMMALMYEKVSYGGRMVGLKHKVGWEEMTLTNKETGEVKVLKIEGNEGRAVAFMYNAFKHILFQALGKSYRGEIPYSNLSNISRKSEMIALRERILQETDTGATTPDVIKVLVSEGFFPGKNKVSGIPNIDIALYQYRNIYSLGALRNFTELTEEVEIKGSVIQEISTLTSTDNYRKYVYESILSILNSSIMPKLNREFLKCYYEIPTILDFYGIKKTYSPDMVLFFEMYPEYKKILRVKRISFSKSRRHVKWIDSDSIVPQTILYKESHEMLRKVLSPILSKFQQQYQDDLDTAKEFMDMYSEPLDFGGDLQFTEMEIIDGEEG